MKAAIFGIGRMGQAIGYAMDKLGYELVVFEPVRECIGALEELVDKNIKHYDKLDVKALIGAEPDIVISSLPYHQTKDVADVCIKSGLRYCDLGGRVDVSTEINNHAREVATAPVFTDLGLAPGWVNILAEQGYKRVHDASDVKMMVGGIPLKRPVGPLRYFMTWSLDGLLNEYRDDCEVLIDGEIQVVPGLSHLENIDPEWEGCVMFEAFCTSGGAAHTTRRMQQRGVRNCVYKTLRWSGHHQLIDFFMNKCKFDDDTLKSLLETSAEYETCKDDVVVVMVEVKNDSGLTWKREYVVENDETFTAMQKSTAFSISSVASLMAQGVFDNRAVERRGYIDNLPQVLEYSDVPGDEFTKILDSLLNK